MKMRTSSESLFAVIGVLHLLLLIPSEGKEPDAELYVNNKLYRATYGDFGSRAKFTGLSLTATPPTDILLCGNDTTTSVSGPNTNTNTGSSESTFTDLSVLLVPRGECSFEYKLQRALSWGAMGVIIYNTLESRYNWNETSGEVVYPKPRVDYDCSLGSTMLQNVPFDLDPPAYNGSDIDRYCNQKSPDNMFSATSCASGRCLIAYKAADYDFQACCAWDIHVDMSQDLDLPKSTATDEGLAIFVTMAQSDELLQQIGSQAAVQPRHYPVFNASSLILWMLAVAITAFASWNSASEYRQARNRLAHMRNNPEERRETREVEMTPTFVVVPNNPQLRTDDGLSSAGEEGNLPTTPIEGAQEDEAEVPESRASSSANSQHHGSFDRPPQTSDLVVSHGADVPDAPGVPREAGQQSSPMGRQSEAQQATQPPRRPRAAESLELTMWHAAFFVLVASGLLMLLFFFQFYTVITFLYGIAGSGAMSQLIFHPLIVRVATRLGCSNRIQNAMCPKVLLCAFGEISGLDILAGICGYAVGLSWLVVWFTSNNPSNNAFYWIIQNVMGACICILFLKILKLNSIKVATVLLIAVFIYDIFFVFLSPYVFGGESVMVTVASGGGQSEYQSEVSVDYCEKYPSDSRCKVGQPLPMLLTIPRINDFRGGSSMLGLGDIVLPGLLISFAARLDEAKYLVGGYTSMHIRMPPKPGGFLLYLVIAYALGLLMASIAVVLMQQGQPALLYLVPATLGTFLFLGRHELKELWRGPRVLLWADRLVRYGHANNFVSSGDAATAAESIEDLDFEPDEGGATSPSNQTAPRVDRMDDRSTRDII